MIPCGGRPESINISNVSRLWNAEGVTNFKYIVEGANLFVTQNARLALEKKGIILYRDSSANKGGVTSSSLEVLVGMSLSDREFLDLMTSPNDEGELLPSSLDRRSELMEGEILSQASVISTWITFETFNKLFQPTLQPKFVLYSLFYHLSGVLMTMIRIVQYNLART